MPEFLGLNVPESGHISSLIGKNRTLQAGNWLKDATAARRLYLFAKIRTKKCIYGKILPKPGQI
jgi:hypothetical protein